MTALNENISEIKNTFIDIRSAISDKGVTVPENTPVTAYAELIGDIQTADRDAVPADIYNHGEITGLNPYYSCVYSLSSNSTTKWIINTDVMEYDETYNASITLGAPILKGNYTKLCFECEVTEGTDSSNTFSNLYVGIRYCSAGAPDDRSLPPDKYVPVTDYATKSNYDKTSPWYEFTRQTVKLDLTQLSNEEFFVMIRACDCAANIYSIWLE